MKRRHLVALVCLGTILFLSGILLGIWINDALDIDTCFAGGGSWDRKHETCVYS